MVKGGTLTRASAGAGGIRSAPRAQRAGWSAARERCSRCRRARWTARVLLAAALVGLALLLLVALDPPWRVPGGPGFFAARRRAPCVPIVKRALWWSALASAALLCAALLASAARLDGARVHGARARAPRRRAGSRRACLAALVLGARGAGRARARAGVWWDEAWVVRRAVVGEFEPEPNARRPGAALRARALGAHALRLGEADEPPAAERRRARLASTPGARRPAARPAASTSSRSGSRASSRRCSRSLLLGLLVADWGFPRAGVAAALRAGAPPLARRGRDRRPAATRSSRFAVERRRLCLGRRAPQRGLALVARLRRERGAAAVDASLRRLPERVPRRRGVPRALALAGRGASCRASSPRTPSPASLFLIVMTPGLRAGAALARRPPRQGRRPAQPARPRLQDGARALARGRDRAPARARPDRSRAPLPEPQLAARGAAAAAAGCDPRDPRPRAARLRGALRRAGPQRAVVLGLAAAPVLALVASAALGHLGRRFHSRYLFFVLALVPPLVAIGVDVAAARLGGARRGARAAALALAAALGLFAWAVLPALENLATHPYSGMREAAAFVAAQPDAERAYRVGVGLGGDIPRVYDPISCTSSPPPSCGRSASGRAPTEARSTCSTATTGRTASTCRTSSRCSTTRGSSSPSAASTRSPPSSSTACCATPARRWAAAERSARTRRARARRAGSGARRAPAHRGDRPAASARAAARRRARARGRARGPARSLPAASRSRARGASRRARARASPRGAPRPPPRGVRWWSTKADSTRSKDASAKGRASAKPCSKAISAPARAALARARASAGASGSRATTRAAGCRSFTSSATSPVPQPRSSTRSPGRIAAASTSRVLWRWAPSSQFSGS